MSHPSVLVVQIPCSNNCNNWKTCVESTTKDFSVTPYFLRIYIGILHYLEYFVWVVLETLCLHINWTTCVVGSTEDFSVTPYFLRIYRGSLHCLPCFFVWFVPETFYSYGQSFNIVWNRKKILPTAKCESYREILSKVIAHTNRTDISQTA